MGGLSVEMYIQKMGERAMSTTSKEWVGELSVAMYFHSIGGRVTVVMYIQRMGGIFKSHCH